MLTQLPELANFVVHAIGLLAPAAVLRRVVRTEPRFHERRFLLRTSLVGPHRIRLCHLTRSQAIVRRPEPPTNPGRFIAYIDSKIGSSSPSTASTTTRILRIG